MVPPPKRIFFFILYPANTVVKAMVEALHKLHYRRPSQMGHRRQRPIHLLRSPGVNQVQALRANLNRLHLLRLNHVNLQRCTMRKVSR